MVEIINSSMKLMGKSTSYSKLLSELIKATPEGGFTFEAMKIHLRIDAIMDKADKRIKLENSDYDYLVSLIDKQKWTVLSKELVDMIEYIKTIKKS